MAEPKTSRELDQDITQYLASDDLAEGSAASMPTIFEYDEVTEHEPVAQQPRRGGSRKKSTTRARTASPAKKKPAKRKARAKAAPKKPTKRKPRKKTTAKPRPKKSQARAARPRKASPGASRRGKGGAKKRRSPAKKSGKRHRAESSGGSPTMPAAPASPRRTQLEVVLDAVRQMPASGRFGPEKVFISEVYRRVGQDLGMSIGQFKRWLVEQNRAQNLDLIRADSKGDMPIDKVEDSEIRDLGAAFHFIVDRSAPRRW